MTDVYLDYINIMKEKVMDTTYQILWTKASVGEKSDILARKKEH